MKLSKKIMALLVAGTMSASAFALAACDKPDDNTPDGPDNSGNTGVIDPNSPNNPSNPNNPANPGGKLVNSLQELSFSGYDMGFTFTSTSSSGNKYETTEAIKFDMKKGDADISVTEAETPKGGTKKTETNNMYLRNWNMLSEVWLHKGEGDTATKELADYLYYTRNIKDMVGDLELPEGIDLGAIIGTDDLLGLAAESAPAILGETLSVVTALANAASATTITDTKATVNVNLMAYNMASDINTLVDGVTTETTVSDILTSNYLKKYLMVFTEMIPVETVQAGLAELGKAENKEMFIQGVIAGADEEIPEAILDVLENIDLEPVSKITPDANSSTYDYILKILGSAELCDLLKATLVDLMGAMPAPTAAAQEAAPVDPMEALDTIASLTAIPVGIATSFGVSAEQLNATLTKIKEAVAGLVGNDGLVTKTSLTIPLGGADADSGNKEEGYEGNYENKEKASSASHTSMMTISNAKIEYTLASGKVTGIAVDADYDETTVYSDGSTPDSVTGAVSATINFTTPTLANINDKKVVSYESYYGGELLEATEDGKDTKESGYTLKFNEGTYYILDSKGAVVSKSHYNYDTSKPELKLNGELYSVYRYTIMDINVCYLSKGTMEEAKYMANVTSVFKSYEGKVSDLIAGGKGLTEVKEAA